MNKLVLPILAATLLFIIGCSGSPVEPTRYTTSIEDEYMVFQLAAVMAYPSLGSPLAVPTDVPVSQFMPPENLPYFASYALAAFEVYYEPSDWDDWLTVTSTADDPARAVCYEPSDWDDWLLSANSFGPILSRRVHSNGDTHNWLVGIGAIIDPQDLFGIDDWNNWLGTMYEPADWDDWLYTHTISDIAALN